MASEIVDVVAAVMEVVAGVAYGAKSGVAGGRAGESYGLLGLESRGRFGLIHAHSTELQTNGCGSGVSSRSRSSRAFSSAGRNQFRQTHRKAERQDSLRSSEARSRTRRPCFRWF